MLSKIILFIYLFLVIILISACTNLIKETRKGDIERVQSLLTQGADVNSKDEDGVTALMYAAGDNRSHIVKKLLDHGADVNANGDTHGQTALMWASHNNHTEIVKMLIDKGAEVNSKDKYDGTALMFASSKGHTDTAKVLLDKGADVNAKNKDGGTALIWASSKGYTDIVRLLLDKGADVNAKNKYCSTALAEALIYGHDKIVAMLLANGADSAADKDAKLKSYRVGQTTLSRFWEDKWDAHSPFYGMPGIIGGKRTDDSLTLIIGMYKSGNLPTTLMTIQDIGIRRTTWSIRYSEPNPEQICEIADQYQSTFDLLRSTNFIWDQEFGQKVGELVFKPGTTDWLLESISLISEE